MKRQKIVSVGSFGSYRQPLAECLKDKDVDYSHMALFAEEPKDKFQSKKQLVGYETKAMLRLLCKLGRLRHAKVYAVGAHYSCLTVFRLFGWTLGKDTELYVHNFYLHQLGGVKIIKKILSFLLNSKRITLLAQSPGEMDYYRELSKKIKITFVPYCNDVFLNEQIEPKEGDYVFTGGYTNRDYPLLAKVARQMPEVKFVFVKSKLNADVDFPDNVKVYCDIDFPEFAELMKGSKVVVVPLKDDVGASGQMLTMQAMRCGKPIVYCDVTSISYYFDQTSGYPYKIGDLDSLTTQLRNAMVGTIADAGQNAYKRSLEYTTAKEKTMVLDIMKIG